MTVLAIQDSDFLKRDCLASQRRAIDQWQHSWFPVPVSESRYSRYVHYFSPVERLTAHSFRNRGTSEVKQPAIRPLTFPGRSPSPDTKLSKMDANGWDFIKSNNFRPGRSTTLKLWTRAQPSFRRKPESRTFPALCNRVLI